MSAPTTPDRAPDQTVREISARIWAVRLRSGLELAMAAKLLGYTPSHLEQLEDGRAAATRAELTAIALLYGCSLAFLQRGIDIRARRAT